MLQFRTLTADLVVPPAEKLRLEGNIISAFVKLMYAFLWQEAYIRPPFVTSPAANAVGAELVPLVNSFANQFNDFTYYEQNFQVGKIPPDFSWILHRGDTFMKSAKFADFLSPSTLVMHRIHATWFLLSTFWGTPSPLECGRHLWKPPYIKREISGWPRDIPGRWMVQPTVPAHKVAPAVGSGSPRPRVHLRQRSPSHDTFDKMISKRSVIFFPNTMYW